MKLEQLTAEQEKTMLDIRDRAINLSLYGGDELDVAEFHAGLDFVYSLAKLDAPIKIHVDSPMGIQFACHLIKNLDLAQVRAQVRDQVRAQVWDQVWAQVRDQVGDQKMTYEEFAYVGIGWSAGWVSFYKVFVELGILKHDLFAKYSRFMDSGVWDTVMFRGVAIGCRRPSFVARDEDNRLHNDNRSAIAWRDGFELFYLDGIALDKPMWERITAKTMSFGDIMAIENADIRALALKYNPDAMLNENAELIDRSARGNELFLIEKTDLNAFLEEPEIYMLRMQCPTGRVFVEGVEPDFARRNPKADVCQAHALGITPNQYRNLAIEG